MYNVVFFFFCHTFLSIWWNAFEKTEINKIKFNQSIFTYGHAFLSCLFNYCPGFRFFSPESSRFNIPYILLSLEYLLYDFQTNNPKKIFLRFIFYFMFKFIFIFYLLILFVSLSLLHKLNEASRNWKKIRIICLKPMMLLKGIFYGRHLFGNKFPDSCCGK